ncbi:protein UXT-like [Micropterus dolomieu]|uniref:protein UXT-like n=1 Tax=Micropterus dolomieu TaxID=147949 RepID=UPI001E8D797A|nr:protein UXT-like [Micropterus dolomieu]
MVFTGQKRHAGRFNTWMLLEQLANKRSHVCVPAVIKRSTTRSLLLWKLMLNRGMKKLEDASRIFVAVGYGFFVEMTHDEALRFIEKKTSQLTAFTEQLTKDASKIKANIRMVLEGLRELQGLTDLPESRRREVF